MQSESYSWKLRFMQTRFSTASYLLYFKMLLFAGKCAEMKTKSGSKLKKKKKTRKGNIKKFPTPHQFIIKTNDNKPLRWKTKPMYDSFIKGSPLPHGHDKAHTEGLYKGPKFLIPLTGWLDYFTYRWSSHASRLSTTHTHWQYWTWIMQMIMSASKLLWTTWQTFRLD